MYQQLKIQSIDKFKNKIAHKSIQNSLHHLQCQQQIKYQIQSLSLNNILIQLINIINIRNRGKHMSDFLFNIENVKLLFIAASTLYSFYFIHKFAKNKTRRNYSNSNSSQQLFAQKLNKLKESGFDSAIVHEMFQEGNTMRQNQMYKPQQIKKQEEEEQESVKYDQKQRKNQQNFINEMNQIMSQYFIGRLSKIKSTSQIKNQLLNTRSDIKVQDFSENQLKDIQNVKFTRIKSCKQNIVRLQDAIAHIQTPTKDSSFQFFTSVKLDLLSEMQDEEASFIQSLKNKRFMRSNKDLINQTELYQKIFPTKLTNKHKHIQKQRKKKYNIFQKIKSKKHKNYPICMTPKKNKKDETRQSSPKSKTEKKSKQKIHKCNCLSVPKHLSFSFQDSNSSELIELLKRKIPVKIISKETRYQF